ncbi:MAG: hypothetical protein ACYC6G_06845 [Desulfobaccales bacterium]
MAKKKQFAGKKTKLAKLPLTQALASRVEGGGLAAAPLTPAPSPSIHLPLTWDEVGAGAGQPLEAAFLFLVRELADLTAQMQSSPNPSLVNHRIFLPKGIPGRPRLVHSLREARESLRDLKDLLSHP